MTARGRRRVLLVQPYNRFCLSQNMHTPTHLLRLAAYLRARQGCGADVVDVAQGHGIGLDAVADQRIARAVAETVIAERWDVVGISLTACTQYPFVRRLLREIRRGRSKAQRPLIVVGGYHALVAYPLLLQEDGADVVVFGDGEAALLALATCARPADGALARTPNVAYRLNGGIVRTPRTAPQPEDAPIAAEPRALAHEAGYDTWVAFHSLGCAHRCAFCLERQMRGGTLRPMDPDVSAAELSTGTSFFGVRNVYLGDPVIGYPGSRHAEYFRRVHQHSQARGLRLRIGAMMRADPPEDGLDDLLDAFRDSGGDEIWIGLEHADEQILTHALRKTTEPARYLRSFERTLTKLRARGVTVTVGLILGSPGESRGSLERLWDYCSRFLGAAQFYAGFYKPYRPEHHQPKRSLDGNGQPWWLGEDILTRVFSSDCPAFTPPGLSEEELSSWKERLDTCGPTRPMLEREARSTLDGKGPFATHGVVDFRAVLRALHPMLERTEKWTHRAALVSEAVKSVCQASTSERTPSGKGAAHG